jgi:chemotaxis protein MotB
VDDDSDNIHEEGSPAWLTSFSDMVVLFLCFFVLLLSFARTDTQTFNSALGSVRQALGVRPDLPVQARPVPSPADGAVAADAAHAASQQRVMAQLESFLSARGLHAQVEVAPSERGIVLRTRDQILFNSGDARLRADGLPVLAAVAELARRFRGQLAVEGHTDDRPIQNELFPSNWELSGARSSVVLRYLLAAQIASERVHVAGYADRRPIASNATDEGRARNRRVEFVFETERDQSPDAAFDL